MSDGEADEGEHCATNAAGLGHVEFVASDAAAPRAR